MKILTVVGARPQFIKAAMVSKAIERHNVANPTERINEIILHTGQHYDHNMNDVFFEQLEMPRPRIQLDCGGGTHGTMTGRMLIGIEKALLEYRPDWLLIYGDTNSTIAGALAAVKQHVKIAHVEAGLRANDLSLPEEVNRVLADRISSLLFCPTKSAVENLVAEGIRTGVHHVGDVMYDAAVFFGKLSDKKSDVIERLGLRSRSFLLATVHRQENTDDPNRLRMIFETMNQVSQSICPVVVPLHPRTKKMLEALEGGIDISGIRIIDPVGFLDMVALEKNAMAIMTDSGGVQKEAYFHGVPVITFHHLTAWRETVDCGWNTLVDADKDKILAAVEFIEKGRGKRSPIADYGDGHAADKVVEIING